MASTEHEDQLELDVPDEGAERHAPSERTWRSSVAIVCASVGLMLFMVRVFGGLWPNEFKIFFPDSFSFLHVANITPLSPAFYAAERPIGLPTLLFVLGRSTELTIVVQTLLYGLAFLLSARIACVLLRQPAARLIAVFLIVRIGLEPRFALWNSHILSESLGMTLAVVSLVSWWRFSAEPTVARLRWASVATVAWLTARDSNVPTWIVVGVPALLIGSFWWKSAAPALRLAMRRWGVITLAVCLGVALAQASNGRNRYATLNNVGERVLTDEQLTNWFVDQGMPMSTALLERRGKNSFDDGSKMLNSPDLAEFRAWARGAGQREMLYSYVGLAPHWIRAFNADLPVILKTEQIGYDAFHVSRRLPSAPSSQLGGPTTRGGLVVWTIVAAAGLALAARRRGLQSIVLALLLVSSFVDLYIAYVGDSLEVQRHMVGPLSRMAVIMVICVAVGIDALLVNIKQRLVSKS